jgi:tRNA modification GTPase
MSQSTIAAIATPVGPGGIGIIRISGPGARKLLGNIFKPANSHKQTRLRDPLIDRHIYYGFIIDPASDLVIDEAIVFFMAAPRSYTREDVVEIQSHSGYVVLQQILEVIINQGTILAEPGEFTRRAFLNGRIDLGQAEAIIDKINAASVAASQLATRQMTGRLRSAIQDIIQKLKKLHAHLEASIEFSDASDVFLNTDVCSAVLDDTLIPAIKTLIRHQKENEILKTGISITIAGIPNAGKSSLLNQITSRETAIVSEYPGTTRDIVKDFIMLNGISATISDTAGIHSTDDPVEKLGIERAKEQIADSDLILFIVEGNREINRYEMEFIATHDKNKTIIVINKIDIATQSQITSTITAIGDGRTVPVSAKTGEGIDALKRIIFDRLMVQNVDYTSTDFIPNIRQGKLLEKVCLILSGIASGAELAREPEIAAEQINLAIQHLEDVCGINSGPDLYDEIFSQFCIGK